MQVLRNSAPCLDIDIDTIQVPLNYWNESLEYVGLRKARV